MSEQQKPPTTPPVPQPTPGNPFPVPWPRGPQWVGVALRRAPGVLLVAVTGVSAYGGVTVWWPYLIVAGLGTLGLVVVGVLRLRLAVERYGDRRRAERIARQVAGGFRGGLR